MQKYIFILSLFLMFSCHERKDIQTTQAKEIDFNEKESPSPEAVLECSFLALETNRSCLVGTMKAIQETDSFLLVSNGESYNLLVFNKQGRWIGQVGEQGNGPGEYLTTAAFFVRPKENYVTIVDDEQKKLLSYSLSDFSFIKESSYPYTSSYCMETEEGFIWYNEAFEGDDLSDCYFFSTDKAGHIQNRLVKKEFKSGYLTGASYMLYQLRDSTYGYPPYDMTVYHLTSDKATPIYHFNVKGHVPPTVEYLNKVSKGGKSSAYFDHLSDSDYISYYDVVETDEAICVVYIINKKNFIGFYDKTKDKSYSYSLDALASHLQVGKISYFIPQDIEGCFLAVLDPMTLKKLEAENYEFNPELAAILKQTDDESNPIICKVRLK